MTRIANSTEAVRRTKLLDRIQAEDFARAWREGRRDEVLARHAQAVAIRAEPRTRAAVGHMPFAGHKNCAGYVSAKRPIQSSMAPRHAEPPSGFDSPSPEGGSSSVGA